MRYLELVAVVLAGMAILSTGFAGGVHAVEATAADDSATWTLMVYMAADVSDELPWLQDVNEMEAAYQASGINVIVLLDPPGDGDARLLEIVHDEGFFDPDIVSVDIDDGGEVLPVSDEVNMGSPETLESFIEFSATEYPADRLVLVLWGHGAGWRGLCPDGYDLLTLPELRSALTAATEAISEDIDMVVLDICNGATMELAVEIDDYAELLVGSELGVPAEGLPYSDILNSLSASAGQSPLEFGEVIVDEYIDWAVHGSSYPVSASLLNLTVIDDVCDSLDYVSDLGIRFDRLFHDDIVEAVGLSEHADEEEWLVDFGVLSRRLSSQDIPLELAMAALSSGMLGSEAVVHHSQFSPDGADTGTSGLSLYLPSSAAEDEDYEDLKIANQTSWTYLSHMLREDRAISTSGPGPVVTTFDSPDDADSLADSATVSWEVSEEWNYTSFYVHVFRIGDDGFVDCGVTESSSPELVVTDVVGRLKLSASACREGEALAYRAEDVTLSSTITVSVVLQDVENAGRDNIEIALVQDGAAPRMAECTDGSCAITIAVPDWIDAGEFLTVRALAADDWEVLSEITVVVSGEDIDITMQLFARQPDTDDRPLTAVLLASALAMLGAATIIYLNFVLPRRRRP